MCGAFSKMKINRKFSSIINDLGIPLLKIIEYGNPLTSLFKFFGGSPLTFMFRFKNVLNQAFVNYVRGMYFEDDVQKYI